MASNVKKLRGTSIDKTVILDSTELLYKDYNEKTAQKHSDSLRYLLKTTTTGFFIRENYQHLYIIKENLSRPSNVHCLPVSVGEKK